MKERTMTWLVFLLLASGCGETTLQAFDERGASGANGDGAFEPVGGDTGAGGVVGEGAGGSQASGAGGDDDAGDDDDLAPDDDANDNDADDLLDN